MKRCLIIIHLFLQVLAASAFSPTSNSGILNDANGKLIPVASIPNLYKFTDVCNVYILRDKDSALLIDLGDGSVLSHLSEIGIKKIDWVLFTHHHREQCQGYQLLSAWNSKIAVPKTERRFFEQPVSFRKTNPLNGDAYSVHGASYLRPPIQSIPVDREFSGMDTFKWHGYSFWCIATPGNSPGSMSYLLKVNGSWIAFSGDVMMDGAKMHNFFDSEWDYGFGAGLRALYNSTAMLRDFRPSILLPSHGDLLLNPVPQLKAYLNKLFNLEHLLLRGYDVSTFASASQDMVSTPTDIPYIWQVSPHLFKFKGPEYFPNFSLILSDNGHALLIDCGLIDTTLLERSLNLMKAQYGLKQIDALVVTHVHGDHFLNAPYLKKKWGTPVWVLENMVSIMEQPDRYDLPAMMRGYKSGFNAIHVDRAFKSGEAFQWEGFNFTIDWMPGQTKYALCMHGIIDSRKVAFTGDNIFGDPDNPRHTGHEALVARNSAILEEGYIYTSEYLTRLMPDILLGGHSYVMNNPAKIIQRYTKWAYKMRKAFHSVSNDSDYRFWFDPFWVKADPYRTKMKNGDTTEIEIVVRNFLNSDKKYRIEIHTPSGIVANPVFLEKLINGTSEGIFPVKLTASTTATTGNYIVAFDVTSAGKRLGEWFDAIVEIEK